MSPLGQIRPMPCSGVCDGNSKASGLRSLAVWPSNRTNIAPPFVLDGAVGLFYTRVLLRSAGLDVFDSDPTPICTALRCCTDVRWPAVAQNEAGTSTPENDLIQVPNDTLRWQQEIDIDTQRLPVEAVDHIKRPDAPAVA